MAPPVRSPRAEDAPALPLLVEKDTPPPLVEEDASPCHMEEEAVASHADEEVAPANGPTMEELWDFYNVAMWEALPPEEKSRREAAKKVEEKKHAASQAAWEAYVAAKREREMELWQEARARVESVDEDARWDAMNAARSKCLINT